MNLVVGEYLEVASRFDGVCLIKETFQAITSRFPSILKTVQQYHQTYGEVVLDLGKAEDNKTRVIYAPFHNMNKVRQTCEELQALSAKKNYRNILLPMPDNYDDIKDVLDEMLDDKFTLITDNPDYIVEIEPVKEETVVSKKVLECSSRGDKRFSAMYARVEYMGKVDTIENHYQNCKRFIVDGEYVQVENPKGKPVDGAMVFDELYDTNMLTLFYKWLWVKYMGAHPELVEYARGFDDYNDMFKGKAINCQADVIREIITDSESIDSETSVVHSLEVEWLKENQPNEPFVPEDVVEDTVVTPRPITLIVTGHRPKDLFGYNKCAQYHALQNKMYQCILQFVNTFGVERCVSGGAQGADQLFFWSAHHARALKKDLQNVVFVPFAGQESKWSLQGIFSQEEYQSMLSTATSTVLCNEVINNFSPYQQVSKALTDRNTHMVSQADYVLGIFKHDPNLITNDSQFTSGTLDCLRKSYQAGKKIVIINPMTLETTRIGF